jgi:hypothetical protein
VQSGYRGIGDGGRCIISVPARPDGDKFSPVGIKFSPSSSPNRGIPRGESGIGSLLPSLNQASIQKLRQTQNQRHYIRTHGASNHSYTIRQKKKNKKHRIRQVGHSFNVDNS